MQSDKQARTPKAISNLAPPEGTSDPISSAHTGSNLTASKPQKPTSSQVLEKKIEANLHNTVSILQLN